MADHQRGHTGLNILEQRREALRNVLKALTAGWAERNGIAPSPCKRVRLVALEPFERPAFPRSEVDLAQRIFNRKRNRRRDDIASLTTAEHWTDVASRELEALQIDAKPYALRATGFAQRWIVK